MKSLGSEELGDHVVFAETRKTVLKKNSCKRS